MGMISKTILFAILLTFVAAGAKATPVCVESKYAYQLALANMEGQLNKKYRELNSEGLCVNLPVTYLYTLDHYVAQHHNRVVVYMFDGQQVYGLLDGLPPKVWLIQHEGHPQDLGLHNKFYSTWNMPNNGSERKSSCCDQKDCYPTTIKKVGDHWYAQRREDLKWIFIPEGKLEHNQGDPRESPDHQSHVCMQPPNYGDNVWCAVLGSGI